MKPATWVVTGATGFLGRHLVRQIAADPAIRLVAVGRSGHVPFTGIDELVPIEPFSADAWSAVLSRFEPSVFVHLAGRTPPADRESLERDNLELTRTVIQAIVRIGAPVRFVHSGSAAELGNVPVDRLPADESIEPRPVNDYGTTKWAATRFVLEAKAPIAPIVGRIFNLFGPGQPANQVFGRYAREFVSQKLNQNVRTIVPGLSNRRDFVDVRDAARALIALGHRGEPGRVYHIGSGVSRSVGEGLATLARIAGISVDFVEDTANPGFGPADSVADIRRIMNHTRWRPEISFEASLIDLWNENATQASGVFPRNSSADQDSFSDS